MTHFLSQVTFCSDCYGPRLISIAETHIPKEYICHKIFAIEFSNDILLRREGPTSFGPQPKSSNKQKLIVRKTTLNLAQYLHS